MPRIALLIVALFSAAMLAAEDQRDAFSLSEAPSWVRAERAAEPPSDPGAASQSVDYLLVDYQANVGTGERFTHIVMEVRTPQGVQDGSSVQIDFDPSYQRLILHSLQVIRQGVSSPRLTRDAVQVLHREADLESYIIDGALTASLVVKDVRVGDIIDYSYTVRGVNPVFHGRYHDDFSCGWHVPVRREVIRVLCPQSRAIQWKANGLSAEPSRTQGNGTLELAWSFTDLKPVPREDLSPSWHVDTPWIDLSEYDGWEDVRSWALSLYPDLTVPPALDSLVQKWSRESADPERRVRAALGYVQQNVRYLGVELGAGSYRPRSPAAVLETRFGDCKDQAYLLVTLLEKMGFRASPVLVHTDLRSLVANLLPSPTCFNHVIVSVTLDGRRIFLDPTQTYQRGPVPRRFIPDYGYGLLVAGGEHGLFRFGAAQGEYPDVDVHEMFTVGGREEPARLEVQTVARGAAADNLREVFATHRLDEMEKGYLNFYAERYPTIAQEEALSLTDGPDDDEFRTVERYTIPGFWGEADKEGARAVSFHPDIVAAELPTPRTKVRSTPMEVDYPRHVVQRITVELPEPWTVKAEDATATTAAFSLRSKIAASGNTVSLLYEYRSRAAEVAPGEMQKYNADVLRIADDLGYRLTWGAPGSAGGGGSPDPGASLTLALSTLLLVAGALGLYRWASRSRATAALVAAPLASTTPAPGGLGGWLVVIAIGLFAQPVVSAVSLARVLPTLSSGTWYQLTNPAGSQYSAIWAPALLFEAGYAIGTALASVLLLVLFFQRRRAFPAIYIWVRVAAAALMLGDVLIGSGLPQALKTGQSEYNQVVGAFISCAIFVPYMLKSQRVKNTFVR